MLIGGRADLSNLVRLSGVAWVWGVTTSAYAVGEAFRRAVVGFPAVALPMRRTFASCPLGSISVIGSAA